MPRFVGDWLPSDTRRVHPKPSPRPLEPRTPEDCPAYHVTAQPHLTPASTSVKPYSQVKSPRGPLREIRIAIAGFACPNPACDCRGIADNQIHAVVGYGGHSRQEYIRDLKCQACRTKFSIRHGAALYRLNTSARRVGEVFSALAEGLSVGAAVRLFGHGEFTVRKVLASDCLPIFTGDAPKP